MAKSSGMGISVTKEERALVQEAQDLTGLGRKPLIMMLIKEKLAKLKRAS